MVPGKRGFKGRPLRTRWETLKRRFYRLVDQQVVEMKEEPGKVAFGCALGVGVNFFPTMGFGFLLAFLLATIFRGNQVSATATSLLTGPLIPLNYALNLLVGGLIQAHETENLLQFIARQYMIIFKIGSFQEQLFGFLDFFGSTFILGAAINAAIFGTGFFFFVDNLLRKRIRKNPIR
jgi:uncharacterized protein (DUF2062 family)